MAAAPLGSCLNDPTQAKCDTPTRIVAMPDGGTTTAESAALFPFCSVYATSLVKSTGNARAYGKFSCTSIADVMELYVTLWIRWKDGSWHQVNVAMKGPSGPGPGSIYANTYGYCRDTATRYFGDVAEGYAEAEGTWYASVARLYDYPLCVV